jgi:hypothetical protein
MVCDFVNFSIELQSSVLHLFESKKLFKIHKKIFYQILLEPGWSQSEKNYLNLDFDVNFYHAILNTLQLQDLLLGQPY